jgi:transcriptional regulator with XRE-family HTH domain
LHEENIVKKTCKELGITQKELAEIMGVNVGTPAQWSSKGDIPNMAKKFMIVLVEDKKHKEQLISIKNSFKILDDTKEL